MSATEEPWSKFVERVRADAAPEAFKAFTDMTEAVRAKWPRSTRPRSGVCQMSAVASVVSIMWRDEAHHFDAEIDEAGEIDWFYSSQDGANISVGAGNWDSEGPSVLRELNNLAANW